MTNTVRITHYIGYSGATLPNTYENRVHDAQAYAALVPKLMWNSAIANNDHDREAWARQAGLYAKCAAHNARMALELVSR